MSKEKKPNITPTAKSVQHDASPNKKTLSIRKKRELADMEKMREQKRQIDDLTSEINKIDKVVDGFKQEIRTTYEKSNSKEAELKNYIATLNSRIMSDVVFDDKIDEVAGNILNLIGNIQDKVKIEINHTKKEMEKDVTEKFQEAERKQQKLMNDKIEEQKKVFEKMNATRNEIDKIKKNFEYTNFQCENLSKENENLKILLKSLEEDKNSLENKLLDIRKEYQKIKDEHIAGVEVKEDENENFGTGNDVSDGMGDGQGSDHDEMDREDKIVLESRLNSLYEDRGDEAEGVEKDDQNMELNEEDFEPEDLIAALQESIKETKKEFKQLHSTYIEDIKQKNEAQQLLQKCIEDLKFDITKAEKDISSYKKLCAGKRGYEGELNAKINNMISLEKKLKILTFIYDNGFQTTKTAKNKLLVYKK